MLTTNEAAMLLGLRPRSVTQYINRGLIKAQKYGRDWLIDRAEIERFKRERRPMGRPAQEVKCLE